MSRPPSSRQTITNNALVRPRPPDLNQLASTKPGALQSAEIKDELTLHARLPVRRYFEVVDQALLPALSHEDVERARQIYNDTLIPLFRSHRQAIEWATNLAVLERQRNEAAAARLVSVISYGTLIGLALLAGAWWWVQRRWWIQPVIQRTSEVQAALARIGSRDYTTPVRAGPPDEFGHILADMEAMRVRLATQVQELEDKQHAALAAERAKSAFLANMSHEIRTPLNAMLGMTEIVLRTDLSERQRDLLSKSHEASLTLLGMIDQVLDWARIEAGAIVIQAEPYSLRKTIHQVVESIGPAAQQKRLTCQVWIDPTVPDHLLGDAHRLEQVLRHLGSNAVKFTEQGEVRIKVSSTEVSPGQHAVRFAVHDTGIGLSVDQMDHLFKPFTQADVSMTRKYGGAGLGLVISQQLVKLMGGTLGVHSSPGTGSEFHFTLVCPEVRVPAGVNEGEMAEADAGPWAALKGKRVLLVDDNPVTQLVTRELLRDVVGMVVTSAASMDEAVTHMRPGAFDVALVEAQLQGAGQGNGHQASDVASRLRALNGAGAMLPVIAMTSEESAADQVASLASGANDCIGKPFMPPELFGVLLKWTETAPVA